MSIIQQKPVRHAFLYYRFSWLHLIRPLTFTATISPAAFGSALAAWYGPFHVDRFVIVLVVGVLVQSAVNMLNDYFDYQKGQDQEKWIVSENLNAVLHPPYRLIPAVATLLFALAGLGGLWVGARSHQFWILWMGALGVFCGYKYSAGRRSLSSLGLAEIIAFLFLGVFPTTAGFVVQGRLLDAAVFALSLPLSLASATMLLTNNLRDIDKDQGVRLTIAMRLGRKRGARVLNALLGAAYLSVFLLSVLGLLSALSLLTVCAVPAAIKLCYLLRSGASPTEERLAMKWAALHHWLFGITLYGSVFIANI